MSFVPFDVVTINQIRSQLPCSRLVERHVDLKAIGNESSGLCPFHLEETPSFLVNDQNGHFHCHECGAHGDVIAFVMRISNVS
jgi:DNA primase